jgi:RimJ/RimL family protein N-acetyltransferase
LHGYGKGLFHGEVNLNALLSMMSTQIFSPAYQIQTQRLVIRCWQPTDAPLLIVAVQESLEHLKPWMPWAHDEPQDLQQRVTWLRQRRGEFDLGSNFVYGIFNADETAVRGGTGFHPRVGDDALEIGYWIHADFINQGLATEVAAALTKVAFEIHRVGRVEIHCDPRNLRSAAVPRKLGFVHEATLRQRVEDHAGQKWDRMIWTLLAEEYLTSQSSQAEICAFDAIGQKIL